MDENEIRNEDVELETSTKSKFRRPAVGLIIVSFGVLIVLLSFTLIQAASTVGIEYNATANVWHIWNEVDDYYVDAVSGIQITNHFEDYWTHNEWCVYLELGAPIKQCADSFDWTWDYSTDNATYATLTGTTSEAYAGGYAIDATLEYDLRSNDSTIKITPTVTNTKKAFTGYVIWRISDIQISMDVENDTITEPEFYWLNNSPLNLSYDNITTRRIHLADNSTREFLYFYWNESIWVDDVEHPHNYLLRIQNESGQFNSPIELWTDVGTLGTGSVFSTEYRWIDVKPDYYDVDSITITNTTTGAIYAGANMTVFCSLVRLASGAVGVQTANAYKQNSTDDATFSNTPTDSGEPVYVTAPNPDQFVLTSINIDTTHNLAAHDIVFTTAGTYYVRCEEPAEAANSNVELTSDSITVVVSVSIPQWSNPQTDVAGDTFYDTVVNHTADWTTPGGTLGYYIFSTNSTGANCDTWGNASAVQFGDAVSYNVSDRLPACDGKTIGWRIYANNSAGNWNVTDLQEYLLTDYGVLQIDWTAGSEINSTDCQAGSPCSFDYHTNISMNVTVTCSGNANAECGSVDLFARYNESAYWWAPDNGDGELNSGSLAYLCGDDSSDINFTSSGNFTSNYSFTATELSINISATQGADYLSAGDVEIIICDDWASDCSYPGNCRTVNSTWDPAWAIGVVNISIDAYEIEANQEYGVIFNTLVSDDDSTQDVLQITVDTAPAAVHTSYYLSSCVTGSSILDLNLTGAYTLVNTTAGATPLFASVVSGSGNFEWDIVRDEGDGSTDTNLLLFGDDDADNYYNTSVAFIVNESYTIQNISMNVGTATGADYISSMDVYICEFVSDMCTTTNCVKVNDTYDPAWSTGWQSFTISDFEATANQNYTIIFVTPSTDSGADIDALYVASDDSVSDVRFESWSQAQSCGGGAELAYVVQIDLNGTAGNSNPASAGPLSFGDSYQMNWTVNGTTTGTYLIDAIAESSYSGVAVNSTLDSTVVIAEGVPADLSFTAVAPLTGCSENEGSADWVNGTCKQCYPEFPNGTSNATCQGQTAAGGFINFTNTGDTNEQWLIKLNTTLPTGAWMWCSKDNSIANAVSLNSTDDWTINVSVQPAEIETIWCWGQINGTVAATTQIEFQMNYTSAQG